MSNMHVGENGNNNQRKMDFEQGLNYDERRSLDLVRQLLSSSSNVYQEERNMVDLLRVYGSVTQNWTNDSFSRSLQDSILTLQKPYSLAITDLKQLENNNPNSFIVKPLNAIGHRFATTIRKKDLDYSFTVINKGLRPDCQFEEFIVSPKQLESLLSKLDIVSVRQPVETLYKTFSENSQDSFKLNIKSRNQKTGNCFVKNPENAIKFAYATRNFSGKDFANLRINEPSKSFTPKWGVTTSGVHRLFVERLQRENPRIKPALEHIFETYNRNKLFREYLSEGNNTMDVCLKKAFDPYKRLSGNSYENNIKLLSQINLDTAQKTTNHVINLLEKLDSSQKLKSDFIIALRLSNPYEINKYFRDENFNALNDRLRESAKTFPVLVDTIMRESHVQYAIRSIEALTKEENFNKAIDYAEKSNFLYKHDARTNYLEGYLHFNQGIGNKQINPGKSKRSLENALDSFSEAIRLNSTDPNYFYARGEVYKQLKHTWESEMDLAKARSLAPGRFPDKYSEIESQRNQNKIHMSPISLEISKKVIDEIKSQIPAINKNFEKSHNSRDSFLQSNKFSNKNHNSSKMSMTHTM